jgi:hypothetical protein
MPDDHRGAFCGVGRDFVEAEIPDERMIDPNDKKWFGHRSHAHAPDKPSDLVVFV